MNTNSTIERVNKTIDRVFRHKAVFETHQLSFDYLPAEYKISARGILMTPLLDPWTLLLEAQSYFEVTFTRQLNPDLTYSWVTVLDDTPLIILAAEFIDHSGTTPTKQ